MELSDRTKILLVLVVILVALYVYSTSTSSNPIQNEGSLSYSRNDDNDDSLSVQDDNNAISDMDQRLEAITEAKAKRKMRTRNTAIGEFKNSSYRDGKRGGSSNDLDKFFEEGNPFDPSTNDGFLPNDESASLGHAPYVSSRKRSQREEDKFNSGDLLPKETNSDFFEDVQAVSVKNRHLINIFRPIGVNTVSSSRKNGTRDMRGEPANPKNFVSPFLNSSIDPGQNIVGLCGGA
jgi:hypothetical protein